MVRNNGLGEENGFRSPTSTPMKRAGKLLHPQMVLYAAYSTHCHTYLNHCDVLLALKITVCEHSCLLGFAFLCTMKLLQDPNT